MAKREIGVELWYATQRRFIPPQKRKPLEQCYNNPRGGAIIVPSLQPHNDYEYKFVGIESFAEFLDAVMYVWSRDVHKNGIMSMRARDDFPVYRHNLDYEYVQRYLRVRRVFW